MSDFGFNPEELEAAIKNRWGKGLDPTASATLPTDGDDDGESASDGSSGAGDSGTSDVHSEGDLEGSSLEDDDTEDDEDDEDDEDSDEDESELDSATSGPNYITLPNGVRLTHEQAQAYYEFDQRLQTDQALREYISRYGQPPAVNTGGTDQGGSSPSSPADPTLPPDLDIDDPAIKFLLDRQAALEAQLKQVSQVTTLAQQDIAARREAEMRSYTNRAIASFKAEHKLDDADMEKVRGVAARINAVDTYLSGIHPITGEVVQPDPLAAIDCALTIALNSIPETVEKVRNKTIKTQLENKDRKKKLGKIGGSSGSVPRTPPAPNPKDRNAMRAAMINEVRSLMNDTAE